MVGEDSERYFVFYFASLTTFFQQQQLLLMCKKVAALQQIQYIFQGSELVSTTMYLLNTYMVLEIRILCHITFTVNVYCYTQFVSCPLYIQIIYLSCLHHLQIRILLSHHLTEKSFIWFSSAAKVQKFQLSSPVCVTNFVWAPLVHNILFKCHQTLQLKIIVYFIITNSLCSFGAAARELGPAMGSSL